MSMLLNLTRRAALVLASTALVFGANGAFAQSKFVEGTHYFKLKAAQPVSTGTNIEVLEVFSYACSHCATFEPIIQTWKAKKPANAQLVLLPAIFNQSWVPFARAFYTAQALNVLDKSHGAFFKAIHTERKPFASMEDVANWYGSAGLGITAKQFGDAFLATGLDAKLQNSVDRVPKYEIEGTPAMVIDGKYRFDLTSAGSMEAVPELINYLVVITAAQRKK
jgi:protein dithiol oxidoreductase (disulfide-forming)